MSLAADLLEKYRANGFADFRGLQIAGKLPITQEVLNEIIAEVLQHSRTPSSGQSTIPPAQNTPFDLQELARLVRRAEVSAADGKVTLHFELVL